MAKDWKEELRVTVRDACREAERIEREQMDKSSGAAGRD